MSVDSRSQNAFRLSQLMQSRMRPQQKNNRARNKNGRKPNGASVNRVYESNGPEGKVRGTPQQIIEKYQMLARDRATAGDRIVAENFLQHAEHYTRILTAAQAQQAAQTQQYRREEEEETPEEEVAETASSSEEAYADRRQNDDAATPAAEGLAVIGDQDGPELVVTPESLSQPRRSGRRKASDEQGDGAGEDEPTQTRRPRRRAPRRTRADDAPEATDEAVRSADGATEQSTQPAPIEAPAQQQASAAEG